MVTNRTDRLIALLIVACLVVVAVIAYGLVSFTGRCRDLGGVAVYEMYGSPVCISADALIEADR